MIGPDTPYDKLPDILTVEEVARYLRVGRNSAYDLAKQNLNAVRVGPRRLLVSKAALGAFLKFDGETYLDPHAGKYE